MRKPLVLAAALAAGLAVAGAAAASLDPDGIATTENHGECSILANLGPFSVQGVVVEPQTVCIDFCVLIDLYNAALGSSVPCN